jgi:hypothetical protein
MPKPKPNKGANSPIARLVQAQLADTHVETINERHLEAKQALRKVEALTAEIADTHPAIVQEMLDHLAVAVDKIEVAGLIAWAGISQLGRAAQEKATHGIKRQQAGKDTAAKTRPKQETRREQVAQMANDEWQKHPKYTAEHVAGIIKGEFKKKRRSAGISTIKDDIAWGIKAGVIQKP